MVERAAPFLATSFLATLLLATPAGAQPSRPGSGVEATGAWSGTAPAGAGAAVYLTLKAPVRDRLVAVATPQADAAAVRAVAVQDGAVVLRDVPGGLPLPPGQPVALQPGGYGIVLSGLHAPLQLGQTFPLRLTFAVSQPIDVMARVAAIAPGVPPAPEPATR